MRIPKSYWLLFCLSLSFKLLYAQAPYVGLISPTKGLVGSTVTITGAGFNAVAANNIVWFGGVKATVTAATATQLTVLVPAGATYQPISILNTANHLLTSSPGRFVVTADSKNAINTSDFDARVDFGAGNSSAMVLADLDNDGKVDVAAINTSDNTISLYHNVAAKGAINTTSFETRVIIPTTLSPTAIAVQDLDGDGRLDIVVTNGYSNSVSVYQNIGTDGVLNTSTFASGVTFSANKISQAGKQATAVAIADINGDGKPDILVGSAGNNNSVSVILNQLLPGAITTTSFQLAVELAINTTWSDYMGLAVADFDGDNRPDFAVVDGQYSNVVTVIHNIGEPDGLITANAFTKTVYNGGTGCVAITTADINGDNKPDLLVANKNSSTVSIFQNAVNGATIDASSFLANVDFATGATPSSISAGDIDGDGQLEIAVTNVKDNTVSIFHNTYSSGNISSTALSAKIDITVKTSPGAIQLGDIDGDGRSDILLMNGGTSLSVIRNSPTSPPVIKSFSPSSGPIGSTVTLTGSGFNQVAANNIVWFGATQAKVTAVTPTTITATVPAGATYQPITVLDNQTGRLGYSIVPFNVTFATKNRIVISDFQTAQYGYSSPTSTCKIKNSDLDGDGKPDMVVAQLTKNTVTIWHNENVANTPLGQSFGQTSVVLTAGSNISDVAIADMDDDGAPDIIVLNQGDNTVSIFRNKSTPGNIAFDAAVTYKAGTAPTLMVVSDFNNDGKPDIVINRRGGYDGLYALRNTSINGKISMIVPSEGISNLEQWLYMYAGDIDNDGKMDFVACDGSNIYLYQNTSFNGTISFAEKAKISGSYYRLTLGDINNDGKLDIVSANGSSVSVLKNVSATGVVDQNSFSAPVSFNASAGYGGTDALYEVAVTDIDGDGKPDIVGAVNGAGYISFYRNTSTGTQITMNDKVDVPQIGAVTSISIADIDGDGLPDIMAGTYGSIRMCYYKPLANTLLTPPVITAVSPSSGAAGSVINITGSAFNTTASKNHVYFGDIQAVVTAATATSITATVPKGAGYNNISVINTDNLLTGYSSAPFDITFTSKHTIGSADFEAPVSITTTSSSSALADLNGDGKADIILAPQTGTYSTGNLQVLLNNTDPGKLSTSSFTAASTSIHSGTINAIADLDGDGKPDIIMDGYRIVPNKSPASNLNFDGEVYFQSSSVSPGIIRVADLDGDGKPDMVTGGTSFDGTISIFFNTSQKGSISFGGPIPFNSVTSGGLILGDVDGDGKPDIICANSSGKIISVLLNTSSQGNLGVSSFAKAVTFSTGNYPGSVSIADMDGDQKPDLLVANTGDGTVSMYQNQSSVGKVKFAAPTTVVFGTTAFPARDMILGDLDGDGKPDAMVNGYFNTLPVLRNNYTSGSLAMSSLFPKVDLNMALNLPHGFYIRDMDGDGKADIIAVDDKSVNILRNNPTNIAPAITAVSTNIASAGQTIALTGTNFTGATDVYFGNTAAASFTLVSPTSINATLGDGSAGAINVVTPNGVANYNGFTFLNKPVIAQKDTTILSVSGGINLSTSQVTGVNYQWYVDGTAIAGATNAVYLATATGSYTVSIAIAGNTITSAPVIITVTPVTKPVITQSATSAGVNLTTQQISGVFYHWFLSGVAIEGATSSSYLAKLTGNYMVSISASNHTLTSDSVAVVTKPVIGSGNVSAITIVSNSGYTLYTQHVDGLNYQWFLNGTAIDGATNYSYLATKSGSYTVSVTNDGTTLNSDAVTLNLLQIIATPVIAQSDTTILSISGGLNLTIQPAAGTNYQWYVNGTAIAGATNATYLATATGSYTVNAFNPNSSVTSAPVTITVTPVAKPVITQSSATSAGVNLTTQQINGVIYQWFLSGAAIDGATSSSYLAKFTGNYMVSISASNHTLTSDSVTVITKPVIAQSDTTILSISGGINLSTTQVTGLSYQWLMNGVAITGATNAAYLATATGSYAVNDFNSSGSVSSAPVIITVTPVAKPVITQSSATSAGVNLTTQQISGVIYQWFLSGAAIEGATSSSYLAKLTGNYMVSISASNHTLTSDSVTVITKPVIAQSDTTILSILGGINLSTSQLTGLSYQWYVNGTAIAGATNATYLATATGSYTVNAFNPNSSVTSAPVTITITPVSKPVITQSSATSAGVNLTTQQISGVFYHWFLSGVAIEGATSSSYLAKLTGNYMVSISAANHTLTSDSVTVVTKPVIGSGNVSAITIVSNSGYTLYTQHIAGLNYRWFLNGAAIDGATSYSYLATQSGSYTVSVTNGSTTISSDAVILNLLQVISTPVIAQSDTTILSTSAGINLTFQPAVGTNYQWYVNGTAIAGATNATYLATVAGSYTVTASNSIGSVTSVPVVIKMVFDLPVTNFRITTTSVTCKGSNNGYVDITAVLKLNYVATINSNATDTSRYSFTNTTEIKNLKAGTYNLCLTVDGQPNYRQCYTLVITEPKDLAVYALVNKPENTVQLALSGGTKYRITINDKVYNTTDTAISLPLQKGNNMLSVTTDKDCQGNYIQQIVMGNTISIYPVPFIDKLTIDVGNDISKTANVELTDTYGKRIYHNTLPVEYGKVKAELQGLNPGVYFIMIKLDASSSTFKIIKN